jgi:peptidoglycan hydrolase CwlO-like protein
VGEPYEKPEVREQSVEEMLTEAQQAVEALCSQVRRFDSKVEDLMAATSNLTEELDELQAQQAEAERLVQKVTYVAQVKSDERKPL